MLLDSHNSQIAEIVHSFNQLNLDFQNFIVGQIKKLLEMKHNYLGEGDEKPEIKPKKKPHVQAKGSKTKLDKKG